MHPRFIGPLLLSLITSTVSNENQNFPRVITNFSSIDRLSNNCANLMPLKQQPRYDFEKFTLKKCCPIGQHFYKSDSDRVCQQSVNESLTVELIFVKLFTDCFEYKASKDVTNVQVEVVPLDEKSIFIDGMYPFFLIQNGALLIVIDTEPTFFIHPNYCLEEDEVTGRLVGVIWIDEDHTAMHIYGVCTLISILCTSLIIVLYCTVKELNNVYGPVLLPFLVFLLSFFVATMLKHFESTSKHLDSVIQFSILMCTFWIFFTCVDTCLQAWFFLPHGKHLNLCGCSRFLPQSVTVEKCYEILNFLVYGLTSSVFTGLLVCTGATTMTEHDHGFNVFFFAQVVIFFFSSGLIIAAHLAFKQLSDVQAISYIVGRRSLYESPSTQVMPQLNDDLIRKLKLVFEATQFLFFVMLICCLCKVMRLYYKIDEVLTSLEGVILLLFFVFLKKRRKLIVSWWKNHNGQNDERYRIISMLNEQ